MVHRIDEHIVISDAEGDSLDARILTDGTIEVRGLRIARRVHHITPGDARALADWLLANAAEATLKVAA